MKPKLTQKQLDESRALARRLSPTAKMFPTKEEREKKYEQEKEIMLQEAMKKHGMSREEVLKIKGQLL